MARLRWWGLLATVGAGHDEQALLARHAAPVVVVDQPASVGALPVTLAQAMGLATASGAADFPAVHSGKQR